MHALDRNIARIAVWEIVYNDDVPAKVAIDEALSLAKSYSDDEAPNFLHGLLSAIEKDADAVRQEEAEWQGHRAQLAAEKPAGLMRIPDLTGLPDRTAKITAIKFRMSLPIKAILKLMLQNGKRLEHLRIR